MKKTTQSNPLKFFNDAKEVRNKSFSKSLIKADNGIVAGPQTEMQSIFSNAMSSQPPIPRPNRPKARDKMMEDIMLTNSRSNVDAVNQEIRDKAALTPSSAINDKQKYSEQKAIFDQDRQRYDNLKNSNGPYKNKKGGTTGSHRRPNGKIMLNSAMKKKTSKKK